MDARKKWIGLLPVAAALAYPFFLKGFHASVASDGVALAALLLIGAEVAHHLQQQAQVQSAVATRVAQSDPTVPNNPPT